MDVMSKDKLGPTFAIETLGCKVNQYESSHLIEKLELAGYTRVAFRDRADVYVVHSCAVTAKAGFQTRQLLRRAKRANPSALVVAAGCYAQMDSGRLAEERLATHILGNPGKFDLALWLTKPGSFDMPCRATEQGSPAFSGFEIIPISEMHTGRTRAILKIQDGCDSFCSYCIVPLVRGRSRSLPPQSAIAQLERLMDAGYAEIVFTGIHLGQWGKDLIPAQSLSSLLRTIGSGAHPARARLSSLEPMEIDPDLIEVVSSSDWICKHLHVPLQSGDPDILARMHRPYGPSRYAELVLRIKEAVPDAAIGADVLAGFPGENEKQFENTYQLIEQLPVSYLHVFPFSPRPGTRAAGYTEQVHGSEVKRRARLLQELGTRKKRLFRESFVGRCLDVLIESPLGPDLWEGLSRNYIKVIVHSTGEWKTGDEVRAKIVGFRGEDLEARQHNGRPENSNRD